MKKWIRLTSTLPILLCSVTAFADAPKTLEQVKPVMNQEYITFAKEWMALDGFNKTMGVIGRFTGGGTYSDTSSEIKRTYSLRSGDLIQPSVKTFEAFCTNGAPRKIVKFKSEVFCINEKGIAIARMQWEIDDRRQKDSSPLAINQVIFTHQNRQLANNAYRLLSAYAPGDAIKTKFGSAMIIDRKDNGLIQIQIDRGGENRWITTDDIVLSYEELHKYD